MELLSPRGAMYSIDSLWIVDIYCEALDLDRRMVGKSWKGSQVPQGCIRFGIIANVWFMESLGISSHDIRGNCRMRRKGRYGNGSDGCWSCVDDL